MKARASEKIISDSLRVIVKAFLGEPVALIAVAVHDECIEVANPADRTKTVGFPHGSVFEFDAGFFAKLKTAYERRQESELASLWGKAITYRAA